MHPEPLRQGPCAVLGAVGACHALVTEPGEDRLDPVERALGAELAEAAALLAVKDGRHGQVDAPGSVEPFLRDDLACGVMDPDPLTEVTQPRLEVASWDAPHPVVFEL